jgi:hypothetical protein
MNRPAAYLNASADGMIRPFASEAAKQARLAAYRCARRNDVDDRNTWNAIAASIDVIAPKSARDAPANGGSGMDV